VELRPRMGAFRKIAALGRYFKGMPSQAPKPLLSGYQPALHATLAGVRGFHTLMHDTPSLFGDEERRGFKDRVRIGVSNRTIGFGLRSGGKTIVTSEYLRAECRRDFGVEAEIVRMGGLGASDRGGSFRIRPAGGELRMLSVCRIEPNKRIDWILRGLAALERAMPALSSRIDWRLDLAGKGSQIAPLTSLATTLGIASRVHFHGFVSDAALDEMYGSTDLFLMPAVQGYGIPAIEALQRGIPVLLHRESGVSDILLDSPWATVLSGGEEEMTAALGDAIDGVCEGRHHNAALPHLPTEDEWAAEVARLCGWLR